MDKKNNFKTIIYSLVFLLILLIGGILYFIFGANNNKNSDSNNNQTTPTPTATPTASVTVSISISPTTTTTLTSTPTTTPTSSTGVTIIPTTLPTLAESVQVRVMYAVGDDPNDTADKNSTTNFDYVEYRTFRTRRGDAENFAMEKVIEGPSQADKDAYQWFTPLKLTGESNCGGRDFTITKDTTTNIITVQLCKTQESAGTGDDARVQSVIRGTMLQFLSTDSTAKVVILTKDGNCFGDQSGLNRCKS